jgi:hypothetical protein
MPQGSFIGYCTDASFPGRTGKIINACRHVADGCHSTASGMSARRRRESVDTGAGKKTASCKRPRLTPPALFSSSHLPTPVCNGGYPRGSPPGFCPHKDLCPHGRRFSPRCYIRSCCFLTDGLRPKTAGHRAEALVKKRENVTAQSGSLHLYWAPFKRFTIPRTVSF